MINNTKVKHVKKFLIVFLAIGLSLLLAAPACLSATKSAWASPDTDSLKSRLTEQQAVLDEASNKYWAASQKQQEAQNAVDDAQRQIDEANVIITNNGHKLGQRAKSMYRNGVAGPVEVLVGASTLSELFDNLEKLNIMNSKDANMIAESKATREKVEELKGQLDENLAVANQQAAEASRIESEAQALHNSLQAELDKVSAEEKAAAQAAAEQEQASSGGGESGGGTGGGGGGGYVPSGGGGDAIVARALGEIGKPYVWGGVGPAGYDCSGLVSYAISGAHVRMGTAQTFMNGPRVSDPTPGDVCANSGHCGIFYGGGSMIHAPTTGDVVKIGGVQGGMVYTRWR